MIDRVVGRQKKGHQIKKKEKFMGILLMICFGPLLILGFERDSSADLSPQSFSYQGRLMNASGTQPLADMVDMITSIYDPSGLCLLYEEKHTQVDLSLTDGYFAIQIGKSPGSSNRTSNDPNFSMIKVFANPASEIRASSANCPGGYVPSSGDMRVLRVVAIPRSTGIPINLTPDQMIVSQPNAWVAQTLQGLVPTDFIQSSGGISGQNNVSLATLISLTSGTDASSLHNHDSLYMKLGGSVSTSLGSTASTADRFGIGTSTPTFDLSFGGTLDRTVNVERNSTLNAAGSKFSLIAGGATSSSSNQNGGALELSSGTSTGTGGSYMYFKTASSGSSGTQDNPPTVKMVLTESGQLGIGTPIPVNKLDVSGNVAIGTYAGSAAAPSNGLIVSGSVGIGTPNPNTLTHLSFGSTAGENGVRVTGQYPEIQLDSTDSTLREWRFIVGSGAGVDKGKLRFVDQTGSLNVLTLVHGSGNIGIGTTSPGAPLTVAQEGSYSFPNPGSIARGAINIRTTTSNRQTGITFSSAGNDDAQAGIYVHQDNSSGTHMNLATTDSYAIGPQVRMTILNNGNVGIGTTAPGALLDIGSAGTTLGTMRLEGDVSGYLQIQPNANAGSWTMTLPGSPGVGGQVLSTNGSGVTSWIPLPAGNDNLGNHTATQALQMAGFNINGSSSALGNLTLDSTSNASKGFVLLNPSGGSVGIGTHSPGGQLHVAGPSTVATLMLLTNDPAAIDRGAVIGLGGTYTGNSQLGFAGIFGRKENSTDGDPSGYLGFGTVNGSNWFSEWVRINSAGRMGIGNTNPGARLDIKAASSDSSAYGFGVRNSSEIYSFVVRNDGYIGVGNSNFFPMATLDVRGENTLVNQFSLLVRNAADNFSIAVRNDGYVGIGTSGPIAKLDVFESGSSTGFWKGRVAARGSLASVVMGESNSVATIGGNNTSLTAWTNLAINPLGGNVGIGTSAPQEKLHVLGNLRVQGTTDCTLGDGSGATNCTSDLRLKENIVPIENALEKISQISGIEFDWNHLSLAPRKHSIGVIAQDVQKVFPTAVIENSNGYLAVDYAVLVSPLIQAAKELYKHLSELASRVSGYDQDIATLKTQVNRIPALEAENKMLRAYLCGRDPSANFCQ